MLEVVGRTEPIKNREDARVSNSRKTLTTKNLSTSLNFPANYRPRQRTLKRPASAMADHHSERSPTLEELERSLSMLKRDFKSLNDSLDQNYAKSRVFARDANYNENRYVEAATKKRTSSENDHISGQDEELAMLFRRTDKEAVSHTPPEDSTWFRDPRHLSNSMGDFEALKSQGISAKLTSPRDRGTGIFGAEIATKNLDGQLTATDLASSMETFPVRLTAPHIVGIRSLLPPKIPVKQQSPTSPIKEQNSEVTSVPYFPGKSSAKTKILEPRRRWVPVSKNANACSQPAPEFRRYTSKKSFLKRPSTAPPSDQLIAKGRSITHHKSLTSGSYPRQIHPLPSETELRFLTSADQIDTRRALVENSPYQQELARLRLNRLRVEEEYLLQLKRESELERIRGPKPKWYEMKGPEFHYECNKNTSLHKGKKSWAKTLQYRNELLESSQDFAQSI